jgi:hypothetical protein
VGVKENGAKMWAAQKYSLAHPRAKLWSKHSWVGGSCWGKRVEIELVDKTWARKKKTHLASFPIGLLESAWVESAFPYALSLGHEGAKWNTIGVVGGANAKLAHYTDIALAYLMENKMWLVHHTIE